MLEQLIKDKTHKIIDFNKEDDIVQDKTHHQVIVSFVNKLSQMKQAVEYANQYLIDDGLLYLVYPKLNNKLNLKGIHRDHIFPYLLVDETTGYVKDTNMRFNQMRSYDNNQTLLGIKKDTKRKERKKNQKETVDYSEKIGDARKLLIDLPTLTFFDSLAPGYQKEWAKYIFEPVLEDTQLRRKEEMIRLLDQGIKSKNLEKRKV